jgi:signal transduction histidine kinase
MVSELSLVERLQQDQQQIF